MAELVPLHQGHGDPAADIAAWLVDQGIAGASQEELLLGYCERLVTAGMSVQRVHVAHQTLHPVYGGIGFDWHRNIGIKREPYEHHTVQPERWVKSPFYFMLENELRELRIPLEDKHAPLQFPILEDIVANGATEYFAIAVPFPRQSGEVISSTDDPGEGYLISWTSDAAGGFSEPEINILRSLLPTLGLALKSAASSQITRDLMTAYLGPDAGARVLSGEIQRGSLETVRAVIWNFDLQGFTRLSETEPAPDIISMLNDYFGAAVPVIEAHGGNVLKFMGDGLLAIFDVSAQADAGLSAVAAADALRGVMADVNQRRIAEGVPHTGFALALHAGDVLYGNIGAENRLDFTIIGAAVNTTARILDMCKSLEQNLIISATVADMAISKRGDMVSLGRYMLRGVPEPQELFTLLPKANGR